ncbi:MAG: hypothetical protein WDN06_20260 [Asticcacaulis sp.]
MIAAVLMSQAACGREPARAIDPDRPAPARLAERDDSRAAPLAFAGAPDSGGCSRDPASAIDGAIAITLGAVRGNDASALLNQIGSDGVDINGTVSPDGLAQQFANHTGRFCDLFACGGREGDMHHLFHSGPTDKQVDAANGRASVFVNANTNDEVDLSYKWSGCKWWLTAIATP